MATEPITKEEIVTAVAQHANMVKTQVAFVQEQLEHVTNVLAKITEFPTSDITHVHLAASFQALQSLKGNKEKVITGLAECQKTLVNLHKLMVRRSDSRNDEYRKV